MADFEGEGYKPFDRDPEIVNRLGFHARTEVTGPLHSEARKHFIWLSSWVKANVPASREQSLALTALQEALMWANAGIAIQLSPLVDE